MKRSGRSNLVDLDLSIVHQTEKAYLVTNGDVKVWLPKSMCENNDDGTFTLEEELAVEKGLV